MCECEICGKEFDTYRGLNGHKRLHGESNGTYSKSRKTKVYPTFVCLNCGIEKEYDPKSSTGKFCSNKCHGEYRWETEGKMKVLAGEGGNVKKYLIETHGNKCFECGQEATWNGKPLTLQLDHVDGNSDNDNLDNLRLLCPNCHSQTPTFASRNRKNTKRNSYLQEYKKENRQLRKSK